MAVAMADQHAAGKESRFVGICIHRGGSGLRANFTLRNVIDGQGQGHIITPWVWVEEGGYLTFISGGRGLRANF